MPKIVGIAGSLRRQSFNLSLLRAAKDLMPDGAELDVRTIEGIPLYNGDEEEAHGSPAAVEALKTAIMQADGLLLATPEYNNGIPGPFKNTIDWLSRPPADAPRLFGGKPVAVIGASPGGFGTILAQDAWLPVLRTLGTRPWFEGRLMISRANQLFDAEGKLTDEATAGRLKDFLAGFTAFASSQA